MQQELLEALFDLSLKVRILRAWENAHAARTAQLSERELLALEILSEFGPLTETELGKIFGLASSSVTELVRKLDEAEVIQKRQKSEKDNRERPLTLTTGGKQTLGEVKRNAANRFKYVFADFTPSDFQSFNSLVSRMRQAVTRQLRLQLFNEYV